MSYLIQCIQCGAHESFPTHKEYRESDWGVDYCPICEGKQKPPVPVETKMSCEQGEAEMSERPIEKTIQELAGVMEVSLDSFTDRCWLGGYMRAVVKRQGDCELSTQYKKMCLDLDIPEHQKEWALR